MRLRPLNAQSRSSLSTPTMPCRESASGKGGLCLPKPPTASILFPGPQDIWARSFEEKVYTSSRCGVL